jgi:DNA-binding transcriptional MerR regulator
VYTVADVARICGVPTARLRYWQRTRLLEPRGRGASRRIGTFEFRDLVSVRRLVRLLEQGVPLRRIRSSVECLRRQMPELERPLGVLRVWPEGSGRVVARRDGVLVEPDGQLLLDLEPRGGAPVSALESARARRGPESWEQAAAWFERGCRLDTERSTFGEAIEAYRRAIEADPEFADAHCNLGTVYFHQTRKDQARLCFERALEIEPNHVEAHLNLATLLEEEARNQAALGHYRLALAADPLAPDTHVSLAFLYEKLALRRRARDHWRRYLQLDPGGPWSDVARRHLAD